MSNTKPKPETLTHEEAYRRVLAEAQHKLATLAVQLGVVLAPVDNAGTLIATGYAVLCNSYGEAFALDWLRGYLAEIEESEGRAEAWPQSHGHA